MSSPSTSAPTSNDLALPVAAIVCIVVVCWTVLILVIVLIRYAVRRHQLCKDCTCNVCGSEKPLECTCCLNVSQSCNCNPSLNSCLDKICPNRKSVSCVDILLCQCFAGPNNCCTNWCNECGTLQSQNVT